MTQFESSKCSYRIVTAPEGRFRVQCQFKKPGTGSWMDGYSIFDTPTQALYWIKKAIQEDDFQPEVVEIYELEQEGGGDERQDA